jgi:hypothetical protein
MIDDVDELLALRAGDKYRLNDIRRRLEIYKRLYISDLEFLRNLAKTYLDRDLSPEPRRPKPGETQTGSGSCSSCGSQMGADEAFCTNCGVKKAGSISPSTSYVSEPEPSAAKPMQVQTGTGKKSRQQELDEYERQYLSKSGIKAGAEGFTITEDGEVGEITKKKPAKPKKAVRKTKKVAKKTTTKTRKPRKKKEPESGFCVKCGSKIAVDDMFCTNCGSKR